MSLTNLLIFIPTNLFRIYVNLKFLQIFLNRYKLSVFNILQFFSIVFCFMITSIGYFLFHNPGVNICTNIIGLFIMSMTLQGNIRKKILAVFITYIFNMLCDVIVIVPIYGYKMTQTINEIYGMITVLLIVICEFLAEKIIHKKKDSDYIVPYWFLQLAIPLCSIAIVHTHILYASYDWKNIVFMSFGLLMINIISFFLYSAMEKAYLTNMENQLVLQMNQRYKQQLDIIMKTQDQIHSLQHDMKFHIRELLAMANSKNIPEMIEYLDEMQKGIVNPDQYVDTGNKELDGNLNFFLKMAHQKLEKISIKIAVPEDDYIAFFDINILISNLLENAITAAESSEEKFLGLEIFSEKCLLYINTQNSYNGILNKNNGLFFTTKNGNGLHGYGLKNINRIVKKYHGNINIHHANNIFSVRILLYLPKEKSDM